MPLTLKQFTEEMVKEFDVKFPMWFKSDEGQVFHEAEAQELRTFLTTAIAEAWSESQKWDEEAVKEKDPSGLTPCEPDCCGGAEMIAQDEAWNSARQAMLTAQAESRK